MEQDTEVLCYDIRPRAPKIDPSLTSHKISQA